MLKVITMTVYNRPEYLKQVLKSLEKCYGVDEYLILPHIEPGNADVIAMMLNINFAECQCTINKKHLDCPRNTYEAIDHGFRSADFVIHLEDDTVPSRDTLKYFEYCNRLYKNDRTVFTVSAYNRENYPKSKNEKMPSLVLGSAVFKKRWFTPWGYGLWIDRWMEIKNKINPNGAFGEQMNKKIRGDRFEIRPVFSRTKNIGAENGRYCPGGKFHEENQANHFWVDDIFDEIQPCEFYEVER